MKNQDYFLKPINFFADAPELARSLIAGHRWVVALM
jgi:hypothetical protein